MKVYETQIIVTKDDLDELNHVNNIRYVQWVNDVAKLHWQRNASEDLLKNYFWVVLSHHITYKSSAFLNDVLTVKTFVKKSEGVKSSRIVEIYNTNTKKLIIQSETIWCLMQKKTNRLTRIPSEIIKLFH